MTKITIESVTKDENEIRLDRWLKRHYPSLAYGLVQKLLRTGQIRVDGKRVDASVRLKEGQKIRLPPQAFVITPTKVQEKDDRLQKRLAALILFQDDDVIVFNKPPGLAVQGGTGLKENLDTMLSALATEGGEKPKLVHRLDRDTSGVLCVARTSYAAAKLAEAFRDRETQKIYWGLTLGVPSPKKGEVKGDLVKQGEHIRMVDEDPLAKSSLSLYQVVETAKKDAAFVILWPITGRTHQLRVHMASLGTPLLGDMLYSDKEMLNSLPIQELGRGLHLHARRLIIPHPRKGLIDVVAPLGAAMRQSWRWFGFNENDPTTFQKITKRR